MRGERQTAGVRTTWERLRHAIRGEPLPLALVDLDALEANVARLCAPARAHGKRIRVATKSVRCPALLDRIADASDGVVRGAMAYAAGECALLREHGFDDVLLAYPTVQPSDLAHVVEANRAGGTARLIVDCPEHLEAIAAAAREAHVRLPVIIDVDVSYRPAGTIHLGVRRSPLRTAEHVVEMAERIATHAELRFDGIMAYEAQIAGLADVSLARRALKTLSRPSVLEARASIVSALLERGFPPAVVKRGWDGERRCQCAGGDADGDCGRLGVPRESPVRCVPWARAPPRRILRAAGRSQAGRRDRHLPRRRVGRVRSAGERSTPLARLAQGDDVPRSGGGW